VIFEVATAAAAAAAVAFALRQLRNLRQPPPELPADRTAKEKAPRGLRVGDVILYEGDELWLAGSLELREEATFVARLFRTPEGKAGDWVAHFDERAQEIAVLSETDAVPPGRVPAELRHRQMVHQLRGRGPVTVRSQGADLPRSAQADYTLLRASAGRLLLVLDFADGTRLSLSGDSVSENFFELLPGE